MRDRAILILLAALSLAPLALLRPSIHGTDGVCNYVFARSVHYDGDLDFTNEYAAFQELRQYPFPFSGGVVSPETGRPDNSYGPGSAILWSPFILGARGWLRLTGRADQDTGYTRPFEWAVGLGTAFWASAGLVLLFLFLRGLGIGEWPALGGVAAAWLLTPLAFYMYLHPSMSHGASFFAAALALFLLERIFKANSNLNSEPAKHRPRLWWLALGAALGLMILIRMQDLLLAVCLGGAAIWWIGSSKEQCNRREIARKRLLAAVLMMTGAVILLIPQFAVWKALYGSVWAGPRNYLGQEHYLFPRHFFHALFSPFHGLFYWHPVLLAGLVGLGLWRRQTGGARLLSLFQMLGLAALAIQTLLIGSWWSWYGGASFGHRMYVSLMPFFALGFAVLLGWKMEWVLKQSHAVRTTFWGAVGFIFFAALYWNLGLAWLYGTNVIPHEEPVTWVQMIHGLIVVLPSTLF